MRLLVGVRVVLVSLSCVAGRTMAQDEAPARAPNLGRAAAAVVAVNSLAWGYNRYVQRWEWADVSLRSWWNNVRTGFQWDDDALTDNQIAHPLHGSLYYNAARGAGFSFWGSAPFVALGSLTWEFLAENVPPSSNDVLNTTLGGIVLGEVTSRVARLLASSGGSGRARLAPRLGAVVLDPMGRIQGWRGTDDASGAPGDSGILLAPWLALGAGRILPSRTGTAESYRFVQLGLRHGSAFDTAGVRPFDTFEVGLELMQRKRWEVRRLHATGLLARSAVHRAGAGDLAFGVFQHYEFLVHPMVMSGQSLSGALLYRRHTGRDTELGLGLHLEGILLGEIASEEAHYRRRDYDYAPGLGARFDAAIRKAGRDLLSLQTRGIWLRSVYGADARHLSLHARLVVAVPIRSVVAIGGEAALTWRRSTYAVAAVVRQAPEIRAYVAWPAF
jgi:hypothetical protein